MKTLWTFEYAVFFKIEQMWSLLRIKYIVPCSLFMNFINQFRLVCVHIQKHYTTFNNNKERKVKFNKFNNCHNFDWKVIFLLKISLFEQFDAWLNILEGWKDATHRMFMQWGFPIHRINQHFWLKLHYASSTNSVAQFILFFIK